ncbi:MAG: PEP-CTERM sorting domain-containing protein [Planctomycetia bacterium]|nr:PEP-CTERM sorting domain-containing protein [Planctomycetia bacterium]
MQKFSPIVLLSVIALGVGNVALSATIEWNNTATTTGNLWTNSANWSSGTVPTNDDDVQITNGGTVDLGKFEVGHETQSTYLQGDITFTNGKIVADAPGVLSSNWSAVPFMVIDKSFNMSGTTEVDINLRRFLMGTVGTSESSISGGTFTYRHDFINESGDDVGDGSMRVGTVWSGVIATTEDISATLNITNAAVANIERLVVGFGGWSDVDVSGKVVVDGATLNLGADATNLDPAQNNKTEYSLIVGHLRNTKGEVVVTNNGMLTSEGRISVAQENGEGTFTLESGTVSANQFNSGRLGRYVQKDGTASFSGNFWTNSVGNSSGDDGLFVTGGDLTVGGQLWIGTSGGANATAYVSGGNFNVGTLRIQGNTSFTAQSFLTIDGAKSTWTVDSFQMAGGLSGMEFKFGSGGYATIKCNTTTFMTSTDTGAPDITASFEIDRIHIVKDRYELITATNTMSTLADLINETDYWRMAYEGKNVVLTLETFFEGIPETPVSEGVVDLETSSNTIEFYTDIYDPEKYDDFERWLGEAEDVESVTYGDDGKFTVILKETLDYFAFNFTLFDNGVNISNKKIEQIPEPVTWGMLLMGFGGIYFLRRRSKLGIDK